jgi:hypothetical protein
VSAGFLVASVVSAVLLAFGVKLFGPWVVLIAGGASYAGFLTGITILTLVVRLWDAMGGKWLSLLLVPPLLLGAVMFYAGALFVFHVFSWPAALWTAFFATSRLVVTGMARVVAWLHSFGGLFTPLVAGAFAIAAGSLGLCAVLISQP